MKRENLKKEYEIKEMNQKDFEIFKEENQNFRILSFEDENDYFMIRDGKKNLFIIHLIEGKSEKEKKERRKLGRDIKIEMIKVNSFNLKLIYHRKKDNEKEFRIYISYKDDNKKLIRYRMRNEKVDEIQNNEEKMIEYLHQISEEMIKKEIKKRVS